MPSPISGFSADLQDFLTRANPWARTGVIAETFPRVYASATNLTVTTAVMRLAGGCVIPAGKTVTSITVVSGATAFTPGTNQWFALYDQNRTKIAVTSDDTTTAWSANSAKTLNLSATYTPLADTPVYVGVVVVGGTPPSLNGTAAVATGPASLAPIIGGESSTGQTVPGSAPTTATAIGTAAAPFYAYLS